MNNQTPLIVPITVEALVVNDIVRTNGNLFLRAPMNYGNFENLRSAEPGPTQTDNNFTGLTAADSQFYNGVYLKWRLPATFTNGAQDNVTGSTTFPVTPNRWLVVRYGGVDLSSRQAAAWIIESDYVWTSPPLNPANISLTPSPWLGPMIDIPPPIPSAIFIGRNVPLEGSNWSESGHSLGLTAIGPGNSSFASYQPDCSNVFSFVDALEGQPEQTLSYQVFGWFSNGDGDPLANATANNFAQLLQALNWTLPANGDSTVANWTLCSGIVTGVSWQNTSNVAGGAPDNAISVAVGNTSIEALTALIATQAKNQNTGVDTSLLEAFQLDLLDVLDAPDGAAVLAEKVHSSGFQKFSGGYRWEIVNAPGVNTPIPPEELAKEAYWLAILNHDEIALDEAERDLLSLRLQLYVMWWKSHSYGPASNSDTTLVGLADDMRLTEALRLGPDPIEPPSLATRVYRQMGEVGGLRRRVPVGDTPDALQAAIAAYAAAHNLPSTRVLKRIAAPRFFEPNNPVVLLSNTGASGIVGASGALLCRFPSQLVTGFTYGDQTISASTSGLSIPLPSLDNATGVPWSDALATSLIQEFFFLDTDNATMIAAVVSGSTPQQIAAAMTQANDIGVYPTGGYVQWTQNPWHPILLSWQVNFYPIPFGTLQDPNWTYNAGQYTWNGKGIANTAINFALSGRIQLTPAAAFNMQARIQAFLANNSNLNPAELAEFQTLLQFVQTNDNWDLLSQALDGFNEQLRLQINGVFPGPKIAASPLPMLIGNVPSYPPVLGDIPTYPLASTNFEPWRPGQFYFLNLSIVDEWGQALRPIYSNNYSQFSVYTPPDMTPAIPVLPNTTDSFVQLPPGLLQPARLDFDLVSALNDNLVLGIDADVDPICGWVLPNHLDASLMAYDSGGVALGEMSLGLTVSETTQVFWTPAPQSPYASLAQIAAAIPHFGPFLLTLSDQGPARFSDFLQAVDETLWTTEPVGAVFDQSLAVLIGRPLAMLRARLEFELNGAPYLDPSWQYTFTSQTPAITGYEFAIELGNGTQLDDGLIGYFDENQYNTFNVVQESGATADGYLNPIGVDNNYLYMRFDGRMVKYVSMLVDPRAPVHATTEILPVKSAVAPLNFVKSALAAMNVTFRVDGILTDQTVQLAKASAGVPTAITTVLMPVPQEHAGVWTWVENEEGTWTTYPTAPNDTTARLSNSPPVLRRGLLQLSSALGAKRRR